MDKMKKALMIVAMIAIIAIAGSMIYYFVFFKPGIAKAEIKLQEQKFELDKKEIEKKAAEEATRKVNLEKCLKEADDWYGEMLITIKKENLALDKEVYDFLNKTLQEKKDDCYKRYGQ